MNALLDQAERAEAMRLQIQNAAFFHEVEIDCGVENALAIDFVFTLARRTNTIRELTELSRFEQQNADYGVEFEQ
ncbi:hypothetical protein ABI_00890 [Asticcacaulis biprosthecium C19]|uniref:Uncharacterized protein n=1 Tax=Asticcacaulis biprosthecium C19 TaxID=715226 RepID=F4QG46_9CAUL|nr:hypothetical protein [Asticcacaulis biprosthecium]EGF93857.1 hypothetical protein ABI_00890 [Asticcacaulis biprosthecium C19]